MIYLSYRLWLKGTFPSQMMTNFAKNLRANPNMTANIRNNRNHP